MASEAPESKRRIPRQERARVTVDSILMATAHLLKTEGFEGTSTNRIASTAGVSIGSLYQYFGNKEAVVAALRKRYDEWFDGRVQSELQRISSMPLRKAVRRAVDLMISLHAVDPGLHNALAVGVHRAEVEEEHRVVIQTFLDRYSDELRPLDPELRSFVALRVIESMIHGTALLEPDRLRQPSFGEEVTELLIRFLRR